MASMRDNGVDTSTPELIKLESWITVPDAIKTDGGKIQYVLHL